MYRGGRRQPIFYQGAAETRLEVCRDRHQRQPASLGPEYPGRAKDTALEVKNFGKQTDADHTQLQSQLQAIPGRIGLVLPKMMSRDDRIIYENVDGRRYLGFDKKYLRDLDELQGHTIKRFAEAAGKASTPELHTCTAGTLPKLHEYAAHTTKLFKRTNERRQAVFLLSKPHTNPKSPGTARAFFW